MAHPNQQALGAILPRLDERGAVHVGSHCQHHRTHRFEVSWDLHSAEVLANHLTYTSSTQTDSTMSEAVPLSAPPLDPEVCHATTVITAPDLLDKSTEALDGCFDNISTLSLAEQLDLVKLMLRQTTRERFEDLRRMGATDDELIAEFEKGRRSNEDIRKNLMKYTTGRKTRVQAKTDEIREKIEKLRAL